MKDFGYGKKTICSARSSAGSAGLVQMTDDMWAVIVLDKSKSIFFSKNFPFTDKSKKDSWSACKAFYKIAKECVFQQNLQLLERLED